MKAQHVPLRQSAEGIVEGRGEKRGGVSRTDETRKWNEGPSGEVSIFTFFPRTKVQILTLTIVLARSSSLASL